MLAANFVKSPAGTVVVTLVVGLTCASICRPATAKETKTVGTIRDAVDQIAETMASTLLANDQREVVLGQISLDGAANAITIPLAQALQANKIAIAKAVSGAGKWRIEGEATFEEVEEKKLVLAIECKLKPPVGGAREYTKYAITTPEEIAKVKGGVTSFSLNSPDERKKDLAVSIVKPTIVLDKSLAVVSAEGSPYKVEILVQRGGKGEYQPLPVIVESKGGPVEGVNKGTPQVDLRPGDNYAVRVINGSEIGAGVEVLVDGVNIFEFSQIPEWRALGKLYFHPKQQHMITGWHSRNAPGGTFKFTVTSASDDVLSILGRPDRSQLGLIVVRFYSAWPFGSSPPADEPNFIKPRSATKLGEPDLKATGYTTSGPKEFGALRAQVGIRYSRPDPPADLPPK